MISFEIEFENCNYDKYCTFYESAESVININVQYEKIVSIQSKEIYKKELKSLLEKELSKISWIISNSVNVELVHYFDAVKRQETDKIGDIDNLTKPIIDCLSGPNGVIVDDSQIKSITSLWIAKDETIDYNILKIKIEFINDYCIYKNNLFFIQYNGPMCLLVTLEEINVFNILILIRNRLKGRKLANIFKNKGINNDYFLVHSGWDYHKSRLNRFPKSSVLTLDEFKGHCKKNGINSLSVLRKLYKG